MTRGMPEIQASNSRLASKSSSLPRAAPPMPAPPENFRTPSSPVPLHTQLQAITIRERGKRPLHLRFWRPTCRSVLRVQPLPWRRSRCNVPHGKPRRALVRDVLPFEVHLRPSECLRASVHETVAGTALPGSGNGPRPRPPASISCPPNINIRGEQKLVQATSVPQEPLMNRGGPTAPCSGAAGPPHPTTTSTATSSSTNGGPNASGKTNRTGAYTTRGCLGEYDIEVKSGGKTKTAHATLFKDGSRVECVIDSSGTVLTGGIRAVSGNPDCGSPATCTSSALVSPPRLPYRRALPRSPCEAPCLRPYYGPTMDHLEIKQACRIFANFQFTIARGSARLSRSRSLLRCSWLPSPPPRKRLPS